MLRVFHDIFLASHSGNDVVILLLDQPLLLQ